MDKKTLSRYAVVTYSESGLEDPLQDDVSGNDVSGNDDARRRGDAIRSIF